MSAYIIDPKSTRDIAPLVLDDNGELRVLPASFWAETTAHERALFGVRHGLYLFPTVELVEHLKRAIGDRSAIEIGSGAGVLGGALGIPCTDSKMQEGAFVSLLYAAAGQPVVTYGEHVETLEAHKAIEKYRPEVVIGAWITHRWRDEDAERGGNMYGPDELRLARECCEYFLIGNERVHANNRLWKTPHVIEWPSFVYSRAMNGSRDFIAAFGKGGRVMGC